MSQFEKKKENNASLSFAHKMEEILDRIRKAQTDGVFELQNLAAKHPDEPQLLGHLAWALAHKQRYEEAIEVYHRIEKLQPENYEVKWRIADRLINLQRLNDALEAYQRVFHDHPDCDDARLGIQYVKYLMRKKIKKGELFTPYPSTITPKQQKNKILNEKEFQENVIRLKSLPSQLYLESSTKCNYYCQTCSKGYAPYYAEDLHPDIFDKVRREIMPTALRVSVTGFGEPTMSSLFDDILDATLKNASQAHFVTNASLLNFGRIEQLTRAPVNIQISIDGATKETFEAIRAGSNFDQIRERLAMIKKLRDIYLSSFRSRFSFIFVAIRKNIHELPDVVKMARRFDITDVAVADYAFGYRTFDEQSLRYDPQMANRCFHEAKQLADRLGIDIHLPPPYESESPPPPKSALLGKLRKIKSFFPAPNRFPRKCHSPWMEPYVNTNGIVTPCCASQEYLGNLKTHSFSQIWNGWRYGFFRFRIHTPFPPPGCRHCFVSWGINGGNAGNVIAREGLLIKSLYFCEIRLMKILEIALRMIKKTAFWRKYPPPPNPNYYRGRPLDKKKNRKRISDSRE